MADYHTRFSCLFDTGSEANARGALDIRAEFAAEVERDEGADLGFEAEPSSGDDGPGVLWIHSGDWGEPEHVIAFVLRCAEAFGLTGRWGFRWSLGYSRPRLDAFGGGAHVLDLGARATVAWIDCGTWLDERLLDDTPEGAKAAREA